MVPTATGASVVHLSCVVFDWFDACTAMRVNSSTPNEQAPLNYVAVLVSSHLRPNEQAPLSHVAVLVSSPGGWCADPVRTL
jgi:hypothetical protein